MKNHNQNSSDAVGEVKSENQEHPYLDASQPVEVRVQDLLSRMTLVEKVAQVCSVSLRDSVAEEEGVAAIVNVVRDGIGEGIGQIENTFDPRSARESVEEVNDLQRLLRENTRLKIPALIGSECAHGHAGYNSTVLPVPLAMACSWNKELINQAFNMVGKEARSRGAHEAHSPVLDLGRDPRWGRLEETFGEDTYLVSQMGLAAVSGLQGGTSGCPTKNRVIASPKHFAGYGQVVGGRNFAATPIDSRTFFEEVLPPFEVAVKEAKVQGMMASHCEVEGVPAHGNRWLLTELLREQWGFEGYVVSDYNDVPRLQFFQNVVETIEDGAALALTAGMDVDLPVGEGYNRLVGVIKERPELEDALDTNVRRILRLKFMLGLFENPYVDASSAERIVGSKAHTLLAEEVASESVVLLKNDNALLPIRKGTHKKIAVLGPNADSDQVGNYTVQNDYVVNILDGIRQKAGSDVEVVFEKGCSIAELGWENNQTILKEASLADEEASIEKAVQAAQQSDIAIVCVGGTTETSREAFYVDGIKGDRSTLDLLGNQQELVMRVIDTGTPTVVVFMGGRPYSVPGIVERAGAILNTFYLGQTNGNAVAKLLFGETNPSGKLPLTIPRSVGQLPIYYSQKAISFYKDYIDEEPGPLFPFGFGLSYTEFAYSNLQLEKSTWSIDETVRFSMDIKNVGDVKGSEVIQVYVRDCVASVVRPAKLLVRFEKIALKPGEVKRVDFELFPEKDLSFYGKDMKPVVEAGKFELMIGSSSVDLHLQSDFRLEDA